MRRLLLLTLSLLLFPLVGLTDDVKDGKGPIEAKLVAKKNAYALDLGGKTADEFRKQLKQGEVSGRVPAAPAVDLVLELTNTSAKEVQVYVKGDPVVLSLDLKGSGAVSVAPRRAFTQEFRLPVPVTLAPGKSQAIPITSLNYGFRGMEKQAYWTEPGDYTLTASFKTGIAPAPVGSKPDGDGFGTVTLISKPVTLKVTGK